MILLIVTYDFSVTYRKCDPLRQLSLTPYMAEQSGLKKMEELINIKYLILFLLALRIQQLTNIGNE